MHTAIHTASREGHIRLGYMLDMRDGRDPHIRRHHTKKWPPLAKVGPPFLKSVHKTAPLWRVFALLLQGNTVMSAQQGKNDWPKQQVTARNRYLDMNEKLAFGLLVVLLVLVGLCSVGVKLPLSAIFKFLTSIGHDAIVAAIILAGIGALVVLATSAP